MGIVTDSRRPKDPKNPDECNVYSIYKHFASPETIEKVRRGYIRGGLAYSVVKGELLRALEEKFGPLRDTYENLLASPDQIDQIFSQGATRARKIAAPVIENVRRKIGIRR